MRPPHALSALAQVKEGAGSEERGRVYVTASDEVELSGSKGTAHFAMKFAKGSKKEATVSVTPVKGLLRDYTGALRRAAGGLGRLGVGRLL